MAQGDIRLQSEDTALVSAYSDADGGNLDFRSLAGSIVMLGEGSLGATNEQGTARLTVTAAADLLLNGELGNGELGIDTTRQGGQADLSGRRVQLSALNVTSSFATLDDATAPQTSQLRVTASESLTLSDNTRLRGNFVELNASSIRIQDSDVLGLDANPRLAIQASEQLLLDNGRISAVVEPGESGSGGIVTLQADRLSLDRFSLLDTSTYSSGNAGSLYLRAGELSLERGSSLRSLTGGTGNAGLVDLQVAGAVRLGDRSSIATAATHTSQGNGGDIYIRAHSFALTGGSQLQALTEGPGRAGNIDLHIAETLQVSGLGSDGLASGLFTASQAANSGPGGNLNLQARDLVLDSGGVLSAQTFSSAPGGNVAIQTQRATLAQGGQILTDSSGPGRAGSIELNASESVQIAGSDPNFARRGQLAPRLYS